MAEFNESDEKEIDYLFEEARQELARVDENAKELKKDIVVFRMDLEPEVGRRRGERLCEMFGLEADAGGRGHLALTG